LRNPFLRADTLVLTHIFIPKGSKFLRADTRSYVLSPLSWLELRGIITVVAGAFEKQPVTISRSLPTILVSACNPIQEAPRVDVRGSVNPFLEF